MKLSRSRSHVEAIPRGDVSFGLLLVYHSVIGLVSRRVGLGFSLEASLHGSVDRILEEDVDVKDRSDEEVAFNGVCCGSWAEIDCSLLNIYMMEISDVTVRLFQIPTVEEMRSMTGWKTNG
jgi:hypothetical protein